MNADWYDYPEYFDIAFRDETAREVRFFEEAFRRYSSDPVVRLLEPGCGSGRLVTALAARRFNVTGIDLSARSLAYLRRRLDRRGLRAQLLEADMTEFRLDRPVDAAFCTMNTFRHLTTEDAARRHLESMAAAVRPGGLFILGLHLFPPDADEKCIERWTAKHGRTSVTTTIRVTESCRRRRLETLRISLLVRRPRGELRLRAEFPLRLYTARQLRSLLTCVPAWELCDVFDFWYEIDEPLALNDEIADTVLVLRRR